eukprot:7104876-Alexandrium_andersonii.AAC.1
MAKDCADCGMGRMSLRFRTLGPPRGPRGPSWAESEFPRAAARNGHDGHPSGASGASAEAAQRPAHAVPSSNAAFL